MLKIRRPLGRLIFNMGIAIPGKTVFLIETAPCSLAYICTPEFNGCGAVYVQYQLYLNASDRGAHGAMVMMCIAFTDLGCGQCPARSVSDTKVTTSPHQNITLQMFYRGGGVSVKCIDILGAIDITRIHNSLYKYPVNPYFPILQIEVWTKWPTFCRLHFQMQCRDWKFHLTIFCFLWNNAQYHRKKIIEVCS